MKALVFMVLMVSFPTKVYAIEPFVAVCKSGDAHRYDQSNGLDVVGEKISDPIHGWNTESWWGKDKISWTGGKELLLNFGKMTAVVIDVSNDVIRAVYTDMKNVYVFTFDTEMRIAILSQQQTVVFGKNRRVMARTAILECKIDEKFP